MATKKRIISMDLIRIFSCLCVITVHFNACVSGFQNGAFVYPNSVFPNHFLNGRLYLGDIGTSLFFMLSGASLMLSYRKGDLKTYYKKSFLAIFPGFYLAYLLATILDFFLLKGMGGGDLKLLVFSLLGMDGYLANLGLIGYDFYKCGEWFLGCLLILYLIFSLLHHCFERRPAVTTVFCCGLYAIYSVWTRQSGAAFRNTLFFLRLPELLAGMLYIKYDLRSKPLILLGGGYVFLCAALLAQQYVNPLTLTIGVCMFLFALMTVLGEKITALTARRILQGLSGLTYPVFLIHHWMISRMITGFDLGAMSRRSVYMLYGIYLLLSFLLASLLNRCAKKLVQGIRNLFLPEET